MSIFGKVTRRTLIKNKVRTIVTIIGIILSASMITAVAASFSSLQKYILDCTIYREGDWHVSLNGIAEEDREGLLEDEAVKSGFFAQELGYAKIDSSNEYKPYLYVLGGDALFFEKMPVYVTAGRLPESPSEILLPDHLSYNGSLQYSLGDTLRLELGERYWEDSKLNQNNPFLGEDEASGAEELRIREKREYTVVGFYERPNFEDFQAPGYTAVTLWDSKNPAKEVSAFFRMENPKDAFSYLEAADTGGMNNNDVLMYEGASKYGRFYEIMYSFAVILISLIMFGSISLIYNAFSISVSERTKEFGLLSSVGATRRQLRKMVFLEAAYVSCIGIPLGILAGLGGIGVTFYLIGDKFYSLYGVREVALRLFVSPMAILAAAVLSFVTVLISAWIPSRRANRITAIEAIRQSGDISIRGKEVRTSKFIYQIFGMEGMLGQKNFKRNRKSYRATVFSLFMSVVLFISASSFCTYLMDSVMGVFQRYDYDIEYSWMEQKTLDGRKMDIEMVQEALKDTEGVTRYSSMKEVMTSLTLNPSWLPEDTKEKYEETGDEMESLETQVRIFGIDAASWRRFLKEEGLDAKSYCDPENPLAVVFAQDSKFNPETERVEKTMLLDTSVKELSLNILDGEKWAEMVEGVNLNDLSEEERKELEDKSTYDLTATLGAHADSLPFGLNSGQTYGITLLYPVEIFDSLVKKADVKMMFFKTTDHEAVYENLKEEARKHNLPVDNFYDVYEISENEKDLVTIIEVFAYGFIVLISLISLANVFNTISTNILLHQREFAMLCSVGMTSAGIKRILDYECALYGIKALAFGVPAAFGVTYLIFQSVRSGYDVGFYLPWQAVLIAVGSVFAVVFSTMLYTMRKIGKKNLIDVLRNENL